MWIETVLLGAAVAVVLVVLGRATSTRSRDEDPPATRGDGRHGRTWTAAGPVASAFPVERTPHERDIGDAAFVDGFVVGRYLVPPGPHGDRAGGTDPVSVPDGGDEPADGTRQVAPDLPSSVVGDLVAHPPGERAGTAEAPDVDTVGWYGLGDHSWSWADPSGDDDEGPDEGGVDEEEGFDEEDGFDDGADEDGFDDGFDDGVDDDW